MELKRNFHSQSVILRGKAGTRYAHNLAATQVLARSLGILGRCNPSMQSPCGITMASLPFIDQSKGKT